MITAMHTFYLHLSGLFVTSITPQPAPTIIHISNSHRIALIVAAVYSLLQLQFQDNFAICFNRSKIRLISLGINPAKH